MNATKTNIILTFLAIAALLLSGCSNVQKTPDDNVKIANPASVNCEKNGGTLNIVTDSTGGQVGMCALKDGTVCEEWAYMRGECSLKRECGTCPMLAQPSPDFCKDGKIVYGETDECGCQHPPNCEAVVCTMDAKSCPDGTFVGRIAPDCEFAPCPGPAQNGKLSGTINIGPICPVERMPPDPNCKPKQETFDAWKIAAFKDGKEVAEFDPMLDGSYSIELPAGRYTIDFIDRPAIGGGELPADVTVRADGTTTFDVQIDTGIR